MRWSAKVFRLKSTAQLKEVTQRFESSGVSYLTFEKKAVKETVVTPGPFVARRLSAFPEGYSQISLLCAFLADVKRSPIGLLVFQDHGVMNAVKQLPKIVATAEAEPLGLHSAAAYRGIRRTEPLAVDFDPVWVAARSYYGITRERGTMLKNP
eukprot:813941-Amphidinium_carterae.1